MKRLIIASLAGIMLCFAGNLASPVEGGWRSGYRQAYGYYNHHDRWHRNHGYSTYGYGPGYYYSSPRYYYTPGPTYGYSPYGSRYYYSYSYPGYSYYYARPGFGFSLRF